MSYEEVIVQTKHAGDLFFRVGKSAKGNFDAIDASRPDDIWFHVDGQPSAHVVLSLSSLDDDDKKQRRAAITQGAVLCKQRSKYKSAGNLEIVYTEIKNVKKTRVPGTVEITNGRVQKV